MGVVVNNGIVMIDHINQLRRAGQSRYSSVVEGATHRLRPILMTMSTTILGLVPLAVGDTSIGGNGPPYFPMARAIIGGLAFSTIISLLVLPTIYVLLDDLGFWSSKVLAMAKQRRMRKSDGVAADA
jgi:HAE1 family hydrophobic/amphiphilic exporter-1